MDTILTALGQGINYFLGFKPYVMLPAIIFTLSLVFGIKPGTAIKSSLQLGIAFIGIFMTFDFFVALIKPVIEALIKRSGLEMGILDVGWPPLAAITWSYKLAPVLLVAFILINLLMLITRLTKVVNIDLWNYWHVIFVAALVQHISGSWLWAVGISAACFVLTLKLAEWSAPWVRQYSGMEGVCIPHLSGIIHFPLARLAVKLFEKIPGLRSVHADPESIKKRLGLLGEPMILGLLMGLGLGLGAGYDVKKLLELAFGFAAVIFILPVMGGILGSALLPISEGMKIFLGKRLPHLGQTWIGLDVAVLFGIPATLVSAVLLIPVSIGLAFLLPGVKFIPLGDLTNLVVPLAIISAATRGNIIHNLIIGIPMIIGNLYLGSFLAPVFTDMAAKAEYPVAGGQLFTSFLDGGHIFRGWLAELFLGHPAAYILIPVVLGLIVFAAIDGRKGLPTGEKEG
jgi:PTS system galactitol-specific IIC component